MQSRSSGVFRIAFRLVLFCFVPAHCAKALDGRAARRYCDRGAAVRAAPLPAPGLRDDPHEGEHPEERWGQLLGVPWLQNFSVQETDFGFATFSPRFLAAE